MVSILAHSLSHCGEIAELFICDAATLCVTLLRSARPCYTLYALTTTNTLRRRLCYLGIVNLGASATLPLRCWCSGQLQALFKCSPKVGVALLESWTNSEGFHSHVIEE